MPDLPVPPQAFIDAREAVAAEITYRLDEIPAREVMRIAVEGAARAIRAAEREACARLADQHAANLSDVGLAHAFRAFADQLRKQP